MKIFILLLIIAICLWVYASATAPEGWQDDDGFHYGRKK